MKFIVSSTALSTHLQGISRVINSKNALPILDCFLFELKDGVLTVTVSDSETTMSTTLEVVESNADGRFAITARTLLDALKEIPEQPLTFEIDLKSLEINVLYQNGQYSLVGQNADEFPTPVSLSESAVRVNIDAQVLLNGINRAIFATADDEITTGHERYLLRYHHREHHYGRLGRAQTGKKQNAGCTRQRTRSFHPAQETCHTDEKSPA